MTTSALLVLVLMQAPVFPHWPGVFDSQRPASLDRFPVEVRVVHAESPFDTEDPAVKQRRFAASFNQLLSTLQDFSESYNAGRKVDLKKVAAIKKAWRQLETADPWFRLEKPKLEKAKSVKPKLEKTKLEKTGLEKTELENE